MTPKQIDEIVQGIFLELFKLGYELDGDLFAVIRSELQAHVARERERRLRVPKNMFGRNSK